MSSNQEALLWFITAAAQQTRASTATESTLAPHTSKTAPYVQNKTRKHIFALCFRDSKQETAPLPPSREFGILFSLGVCSAHAALPVHVIHSICCKVEALDLGVTCFESTGEE